MAVAAIGLAIGAVGVAGSLFEQSAANAEAQQALQFQQQQANLENAMAQRQAIRQSRIAYGQSQQEAANQGAGDTSASQGGLGSIKSQLDTSLSFLDSSHRLADAAGQAIGRENADRAAAGIFGAVGNVGGEIFSNSDAIKKAFGG